MKKKLSQSLKFAIQQRSIAQNSLMYYSTGHWIDKNEEKHVIEHAERFTNKYSTTMKDIQPILDKLKLREITAEEAKQQVLDLFGVSGSSSQLDQLLMKGMLQTIDTISLLVNENYR